MESSHSKFDPSNSIHPTAIIYDNVSLGKGNKIGAYSIIGSNGEIRNVEKFEGTVLIGDNNIISELVTIQRPAIAGQSTIIGDNNILMAHSHVGHDAKIGSRCEISSGSIIGGYVVIEDEVKIKLKCVIRNRKKVGKGALIGMGSVVVKDIEAGKTVYGNPAKERKSEF